jgi:hypothetical protein
VQPLIDSSKCGNLNQITWLEVRACAPPAAIRDVLEATQNAPHRGHELEQHEEVPGGHGRRDRIINFDAAEITPEVRASSTSRYPQTRCLEDFRLTCTHRECTAGS